MDNVLALIPARAGSCGVPHKNFKELAGRSPLSRAVAVVRSLGVVAAISTDADLRDLPVGEFRDTLGLRRPTDLAQDDTPMIAVVQHALTQIPGPPDQIILLLQQTQPLRTPAHLQRAMQLLEATSAESVVSVLAVPEAQRPPWALEMLTSPAMRTLVLRSAAQRSSA